MVRTAFRVLLRTLVQAGQMMMGASVEVEESLFLLKVMGTSVLRDKGCVSLSDDAGHIGASFEGFAGPFPFVDGVRDGTQKEGRVGLAASKTISTLLFKYQPRAEHLPSHHLWPFWLSVSPPSRSATSPPHPTQISS